MAILHHGFLRILAAGLALFFALPLEVVGQTPAEAPSEVSPNITVAVPVVEPIPNVQGPATKPDASLSEHGVKEWLSTATGIALGIGTLLGALGGALYNIIKIKNYLNRLRGIEQKTRPDDADAVPPVRTLDEATTAIENHVDSLKRLKDEALKDRETRGKQLLADLSSRLRARQNVPSPPWDALFTQQIKLNEEIMKRVQQLAKVVVVASGKGGVGKSMLSLGLTEAFIYDNQRTLLVDFDLHNRGLTSLFAANAEIADGERTATTSVYKELQRFDNLLLETKAAFTANPSHQSAPLNTTPTPIEQTWKRERDRGLALDHFGLDVNGKPNVTALIQEFTQHLGLARAVHLAQVPSRDGAVTLNAAGTGVNGKREVDGRWLTSFLPSLNPDDRFLGSKEFEVDFVEVFFFFLGLQALAAANGFTRIVIDCHGAHDHLMIGAIHAANALLVVTTPEPGGFDGTYDLVAFAKKLQDLREKNFPTQLVLNNCRDFQREAVAAITEFVKGRTNELDIDAIFEVPTQKGVPVVSSGYRLGDISQQPELWTNVRKIVADLDERWLASTKESVENQNIKARETTDEHDESK